MSFTAEFDALSNPDNTAVGSPKQSAIILIIKRKIQILFIIINMIKNLNL